MIVHRLESNLELFNEAVGLGVYSAHLAEYLCSDSTDENHPTPHNETRLENKFTVSHVCCFKSIDDLRTWFDTIDDASARVLEATSIRTYSVPDEHYHQGRWQSIAHADYMTRVESHPATYKG